MDVAIITAGDTCGRERKGIEVGRQLVREMEAGQDGHRWQCMRGRSWNWNRRAVVWHDCIWVLLELHAVALYRAIAFTGRHFDFVRFHYKHLSGSSLREELHCLFSSIRRNPMLFSSSTRHLTAKYSVPVCVTTHVTTLFLRYPASSFSSATCVCDHRHRPSSTRPKARPDVALS